MNMQIGSQGVPAINFLLNKNIEQYIDNSARMSKERLIEDMEAETKAKQIQESDDSDCYDEVEAGEVEKEPHKFKSDPIQCTIKSIDDWKRLNCEIDKKTYKQIQAKVKDWHEKGCISEWSDRKNRKHYYLKVKLSQWDIQPCNFKKFEKYLGQKCELRVHVDEYDFVSDDGKQVCGWTARLAYGSPRVIKENVKESSEKHSKVRK